MRTIRKFPQLNIVIRLALLVAVLLGTFVNNQAALAAPDWNCNLYVFNVGVSGLVTANNNSDRDEPAQKADVIINGQKVSTLDVPALSAHQSARIGNVEVPLGTGFSWIVDGSVDCASNGNYLPVNSTPRTCEDFGYVTILEEEDWVQHIKRGQGPFNRSYSPAGGATFVVVNTGWEWTGSYNQFQLNEIHRIDSPFGSSISGDYGNEELEHLVVWFDTQTGATIGDFDVTLSFAGDSFQAGSHNSHVAVNWCKDPEPFQYLLTVEKYHDLDQDGFRDNGEPLMSGWTFDALFKADTVSVTTDDKGQAQIGMFTEGDVVTITERLQDGWIATTPNPLVVTMGKEDKVVQFGNYQSPIVLPDPVVIVDASCVGGSFKSENVDDLNVVLLGGTGEIPEISDMNSAIYSPDVLAVWLHTKNAAWNWSQLGKNP